MKKRLILKKRLVKNVLSVKTVNGNGIYNLVFNTAKSSGEINADGGFEYWIIDTCKVNITYGSAQFTLSDNWSAPYQNYLIFKNTELTQSVAPTAPLFKYSTSYVSKVAVKGTVIFDKDCTVTRLSNNNWVYLSDGLYTTSHKEMSYKQALYFELGCRISTAAMPSCDIEYKYNKLTSTQDGDTVFTS